MKKVLLFSLLILSISTLACTFAPEMPVLYESKFTPQPTSLETFPLDKLDLYIQDQPISVDIDTLLISVDDPQLLDEWNKTLTNCQTHRRNHPKYTDHYLVIASHANGNLLYDLMIDSDDNNEVDLSPIETKDDMDFSVVYAMGLYRCNGLKDLLAEITSK